MNADPFPFIVARGRSGTTLLRAMFDAHPDMAIPGESHFVAQFARVRTKYEGAGGFDIDRFAHDLFDHWAFRRWRLSSTDVLDAYEGAPPGDYPSAIRTLYAAYARNRGKTRYGDKTPSYVLHVRLLADTFPEARFIHLIRDGRDVALSYLDTDFGSRTLGQAAIYWDRFVRAGREAGRLLGTRRYREVRYEDLVRETERVLRELCAFVGLPFDDRMLRYYERSKQLMPTLSHTQHHGNLGKPPTAGLRDWRRELSPRDVAVFEYLAGDLLDELGYERLRASRGPVVPLVVARFRIGTRIRQVVHGARVRGRKLRKRIVRRVVRLKAREREVNRDRVERTQPVERTESEVRS